MAKLSDYIENIVDNRGKNPEYLKEGDFYVIDNGIIKNSIYPDLKSVTRYISKETHDTFLRGYLEKDMPIMTLVGNGIGNVTLAPGPHTVIVQNTIGLKTKPGLDSKYLYYYLLANQKRIQNFNRGSGQPSVKRTDVLNLEVEFPKLSTQRKISDILYTIDSRIEQNNEINDNLLQQLFTIYNHFFEENDVPRIECRADEYFDIKIGKTPPRKEQQWFSFNDDDVTWISIADMGKGGIFISESSEYLSKDAIRRFNVSLVPDNTVILSFKLTVGRVAIASGVCSTNEAIAHFNTDKPEINPYLFCYLKKFKYQTLGSTSSIATAINSKIIKSLSFIIPNDDELIKFNNLAIPIMNMIKHNELEIKRLSNLRGELLSKLLNGDIDISLVEII